MLTDCHYGDLPYAKRKYPVGDAAYRESAAKLAEFVDAMNSERPDFVIELGDFKDAGKDRAGTLAFLEKIESVFARFDGERYHVPGNHDFDKISPAEFFARTPNGGKTAKRGYYSFDRGGVAFIVLDACYDGKMRHYDAGGDWKDSNLPPEQLDWLERTLAAAPGAAVVFCHQCLSPLAHDAHRVRNAAAARNVLERSGKVKAVFTGHQHCGYIDKCRGIMYYSLRAMVLNSGVEENAYALVEVASDGGVMVRGLRKAPNTFTA